MGIHGSYGDYTARIGGLTEGFSGGRSSGKLGTLYSRAARIPATHTQRKVVNDVKRASTYIADMSKERLEALVNDVNLGYIVKVRPDTYIKEDSPGLFAVFTTPSQQRVVTRKTSKYSKPSKAEHVRAVDDAYQQLLASRNRKKDN